LRDFKSYVQKWYSTSDEIVIKNIKLKEEHSYRVRDNIVQLSKLLGLEKEVCFLAEIVGLFHDIARFPQFYKFKTFDDRKSFDHAEKGVEILKQQAILENLTLKNRQRVFSAIKYHNKKNLPEINDPIEELLAKLIRDADKIDIWYVVGDELSEKEDPSISLGYSGKQEYNPKIIDALLNRQIVDYNLVRSTLDFKLTTLAWVYDINFLESFLLIKKKRVLEPIIESLPINSEIRKVVDIIQKFVRERYIGIKKRAIIEHSIRVRQETESCY